MSVKSEMVNGTKPYQVKIGRPNKDETDLRSDATPRMPHERDESEDSQESGPRDEIKQAYDDIMSGQMDTDCREVRGVEETVEGGGDSANPCGLRPPLARAEGEAAATDKIAKDKADSK